MAIIDTAQCWRFALVVDHVPKVVQQRCDNQRCIGAILLGAFRRLQRVLQLGDGSPAKCAHRGGK